MLAYISSFLALVAVLFGVLIYFDSQPSINYSRNIKMAEASSAASTSENFKAKNQSVFILGATGLTGKELVKEVLERGVFNKVVLIGRREVKYDDPLYEGVEQRVVDFEKLDDYSDAFKDIEVGFCCLGTTRGKAGTEGFKRVDFDYVLHAAQLAKQGGCKHFTLLSSQAANKDSSLLYTKVKGQIEAAVQALTFQRYSIFRPGFLMGHREERRIGEIVLSPFLKLMYKVSPTTMTMPTITVAKAMLNNALATSDQPNELYENKDIYELAGEIKKKS